MGMVTKQLITQEYLKSRLDLRDGWFYWKPVPVTKWQDKRFNNQYARKRAGCFDKHGYRQISFRINGKYRLFFEHRLIWLWHHGHFPEGEIDHIDGVKDNNNITNLRAVDRAENGKNQRIHKNNKSGVMGVHWHKVAKKWQAAIYAEGENFYLGLFIDKQDAIKARKAAEIKYGFHSNHNIVVVPRIPAHFVVYSSGHFYDY